MIGVLNAEKTIGAIVAENYRTASVFRKFGIDFCCKGGRTIREASAGKHFNPEEVEQELRSLDAGGSNGGSIDYRAWPLDLLADYIEKTHHRYVADKTPELRAYLNKINKVHGDRHPELKEIETLFFESSEELLQHMKKEELMLFPYIREMVAAERHHALPKRPPFGAIESPINAMMLEHEQEGDRFARIAELSQGYTPPEDACTTYKVAFANLKAFEEDLHTHIHLENNILFPKSIELDQALTRQLSK
jgi:regulator of cell morphogenesis and NO signaling